MNPLSASDPQHTQATQATHGSRKHPQRLDILLKDYELAESRLKESEARIIQVSGLALPIMGASTTTSYLLIQQSQNRDVSRLVAWLAPLLFILVFTLILYTLYFKVSHYYHCRILADLINREVGDDAGATTDDLLFRFKQENPYNFASLKHGSKYFLMLYLLFLGISVALLVVTLWQSFEFIKRQDANYVGVYFLLYGVAFSLELGACWGVLKVLPRDYTSEYNRIHSKTIAASTRAGAGEGTGTVR